MISQCLCEWLCMQPPLSGTFRRGELKQCIRANFEASSSTPAEQLPKLLDLACSFCFSHVTVAMMNHSPEWCKILVTGCIQGFDALRVLGEQYTLQQCSAEATTKGVYVEITTACIGSKIPLDLIETPTARPVWTYRCRIENVGWVMP